MKITIKLILLLSVMLSCSPNRYLLNDEEPDSDYLANFITELADLGEVSKHPMIVVDGKPYRWAVELKEEKLQLKKEQIASIEKLKSKVAIDMYGEPAKNGVLIINTKQKVYDDRMPFDKHKVLYLLEGEEISLQDLQNIDPKSIQSITVIKNKEEMKKYTSNSAFEGVILLNTK